MQAWGKANGVAELVIRDICVIDAMPVLGTGNLRAVQILLGHIGRAA